MNHFIKLPDGTIINVAHVDIVNHSLLDGSKKLVISTTYKYAAVVTDDPDGKIYEYFNGIAQEIGGEL